MNLAQQIHNMGCDVIGKTGRYIPQINKRIWWENRDKQLLFDEILENIPSPLYNVKDFIHIILSDSTFPTCEVCGVFTKFHSGTRSRRFCSSKCRGASKAVYEKYKETNLERHGTTNPFNNPQGRSTESYEASTAKTKQTMVDRYGVDHNSKLRKTNLSLFTGFESFTRTELANMLHTPYSTLNRHIRETGVSVKEPQSSTHEDFIESILLEIGVEYIKNDRTRLIKHELDFYIPTHDIAIEVNGVYWHCTPQKDKDYHLNKTIECEKLGTQLIHFTDHEIDNHPEICASMVRARMGICERIYARKCNFVYVESPEAKMFHIENHIAGYRPCSTHVGLKYNGKLCALMSLGKPRFSKAWEYEIFRFSTKLDSRVIGGFSKILKNSGFTNIVTYADRRFSTPTHNVYKSSGFKYVGSSSPNYQYTKDHRLLFSRHMFQKHKLKDKLDTFDPLLSESENMGLNGYKKLYDCGTLIYTLEKP